MKIIHYPHPTLRHKSKPVRRVDAELRGIVREMFELMYEAEGIGLAANQVDLPLRFFIANLRDRGDNEELVFINPVISAAKGNDEADEGCLSLPGLYAPVRRPVEVKLSAYNLDGEEINCEINGLLARVVQHETDHLDGVLFIDRLSPTVEADLRGDVGGLESKFEGLREAGEIPSDQKIADRLAEIESKYCD